MLEPTRLVFDIQRFSIRDGPGIRTTVFFKGCPLDCWWCHNPESRSSCRQSVHVSTRCIRCGACAEVCPTGAARGEGACTLCGACVEACPTGAREMVGREMTARQVVAEVLKDRVFYEESGGGATFSGGEPLLDPAFLGAVLDGCRAEGIHTAVDTSGYAPPEVVEGIGAKADLFLYDLKMMDPVRHREFTGVTNELILGNLRKLSASGARIIVRIPLIPGVNDDEGNLLQTARFLADLGLVEVQLLPYHVTARDKYRRLQVPYRMSSLEPPPPAAVAGVASRLEAFGLHVKVGG